MDATPHWHRPVSERPAGALTAGTTDARAGTTDARAGTTDARAGTTDALTAGTTEAGAGTTHVRAGTTAVTTGMTDAIGLPDRGTHPPREAIRRPLVVPLGKGDSQVGDPVVIEALDRHEYGAWFALAQDTAITEDEPTVEGGPMLDGQEGIAFLHSSALTTQEVH